MNCLIRVLPLKREDINEQVEEVLAIIRRHDFTAIDIGPVATTVQGEKDKVFDMLRAVHDHLETIDRPFVMDVSLSNVCGAKR